MSVRRGRVFGVALVLAAVALPAPAAAQRAPDGAGPAVVLFPQAVAIGEPVTAVGGGWAPDSLAVVELCGNAAARGSLDCTQAQERGIDGDGNFRVTLTATPPPAPCPCVVSVTALGGDGPGRVVAPLRIEGVPEAPVDDPRPPSPELDVTAWMEGSPSAAAWFGGAQERTLVLAVLNVGDVPADLRLDVAIGPGAEPDTAVETGSPPGTIAPGERRVLRVPVRFEALAIGHQVVSGEVAAPGTIAPFEVGVGIQPWGLYAAAFVVIAAAVGAGLAFLWRRVRGRHGSAQAPTLRPDAVFGPSEASGRVTSPSQTGG